MDEKKYCLENLFDLECIAKLLRIIAKTKGANEDIAFEYDGKLYNVKKDYNSVKLCCSDDRYLEISARTMKESDGIYTSIIVSYLLLNSDLTLYKNIRDNRLSDLVDLETFQMAKSNFCVLHHFVGNLPLSYKDFTDNSIDKYMFTEDGIKYKNYLISKDCEKVISADGKTLPSKEEIEKFSFEEEKEKYLELINNSNLDASIKKMLIEKYNDEDLSKLYKEVLDLYRMLPGLKDAIRFQKALVDGSVENYLFSKDELDLFISKLTIALKDKMDEYDDFDVIEEAKKFVKTLSDVGRDIINSLFDEDKK